MDARFWFNAVSFCSVKICQSSSITDQTLEFIHVSVSEMDLLLDIKVQTVSRRSTDWSVDVFNTSCLDFACV